MVKKGKKKFKGGVSRNAQKQSKGTQYGHLNLPKGISVFKEEPKTRVSMDVMPYEVTDPNHPDRDDEYGIAVPGELWYKRPYWLHRNIGPNNENIVCPSSAKQKCPICEYRTQMLRDGADWQDESVKALKPSMRNLYIVIPKGQKNYDEKPHIWDISQFLFQEKLNEEIQENEDYETFPDLEEGYTLRVRFSEEQLGNNKFADTSRIDFQERQDPYSESILEEVPNLDEVIEVPSYKSAESTFFGGLDNHASDAVDDDDDDDEFTDEDTPWKEEEEEQDEEEEAAETEEEEEEDDEDEEDKEQEQPKKEPPKRQRSTKGKKGNKCPHGYKFGEDCEEYDECDDCEKWEECMDAAEGR